MRRIDQPLRHSKKAGQASKSPATGIPGKRLVLPLRAKTGGEANVRGIGARETSRLGLDPLRMLGMARSRVVQSVEQAGGRVLAVVDEDVAGSFPSSTYYVTHRRI